MRIFTFMRPLYIDINLKDRAKRYHKSSIFNLQSSFPRISGITATRRPACPG
ncbi:hypothetical protein D1AOALGA4SA_13034 [Olavius algarvensis Delta 1 endosymbiont]|nr:hypothetical protein D1AOALGA4SA_13034 [Olavius algarvensis Delta 1 endosymbiont]